MKNEQSSFVASMVIALLLLTVSSRNFAQTFVYKPIPPEILAPNLVSDAEYARQISQSSGYYNIVNSLPAGYVTDGTVDYTNYVQLALNTYRNVIFPPFPILVSARGLGPGDTTALYASSNSNLVFPKNSKLILKPNRFRNYRVLRLLTVQNVNIYFPVIEGERILHDTTGDNNRGEWGFGISITGCKSIFLKKPKVTNCWGDGIYIGRSGGATGFSCEKILINSAILDNNRRNGITITGGDSIVINNMITANTNGTSPRTGIDIEPNYNYETFKTVIIRDAIAHNNHTAGVDINLQRLRGPIAHNDINIKINGLKMTEYSAYPVTLTLYKRNFPGLPLDGRISIRGLVLGNYYRPFIFYDDDNNNTIPTCVSFGYALNKETVRAYYADQIKNRPNYYVGCGNLFGSSVFRQLSALSSNNQITVNWATTTQETNALRYEIEASKDQVNFTKIGEMNSKAASSNSEELLTYSFVGDLNNIIGLAGIPVISFLMFLFPAKKKKWWVILPIFLLGILFGVSCKREMMSGANEKKELYVRVTQIDKDGEKEYSDIVEVIKK